MQLLVGRSDSFAGQTVCCIDSTCRINVLQLIITLLSLQSFVANAVYIPKRYLVQLDSMANVGSALNGTITTFSQPDVMDNARTAGLNIDQKFVFSEVFQGVSVEFRDVPGQVQVETLQRLPGVTAVFPVRTISRPIVIKDVSAQDVNSNIFISVDEVHKKLGFTGTGIRVGIIDTGVDYTHPDLGGCLAVGPGCKVVGGYDFVGDDYGSATGYEAKPDADPLDCAGHGTHVAGIIGAKGNITGVAPDAQLYAYKVFGCDGETSDDAVLKAVEQAVKDKVQVINLSLGTDGSGWPTDPVAMAISKVVSERGIVVAAAAGNAGNKGTYYVASPSTGYDVISVASFGNTAISLPVFEVSKPAGTPKVPYQPASPASPLPTGNYILQRLQGKEVGYDGCGPLEKDSLVGKVALMGRGGCTFFDKAQNSKDAGALGIIVFNNVGGMFTPKSDFPAWPIPVIGIDEDSGNTLAALLASGQEVEIALTNGGERVDYALPNGGRISPFSSKGPSLALDVKPDLGAPGGTILSTWPLSLKTATPGYQILSGTSMATPHVAGVAALMLQAKPWLAANAKRVRDILQNTAHPRYDPEVNSTLSGVHAQGAGLVDVYDAVRSQLSIFPTKVALRDGNDVKRIGFQVLNSLATAVVLTVSHEPGTTEERENGGTVQEYANVSLSTSTLVVAPQAAGTVDVTVEPPQGLPSGTVYSGFITFSSDVENITYSVPYLGVTGNYQKIQVVTDNATLTDCNRSDVFFCDTLTSTALSDLKFSVANNTPAIYVSFVFAAQRVTVELVHADTNTVVDKYSRQQLPYPVDPPQSQRFPVKIRKVVNPSGLYFVRVTVLKPLGTPASNNDVYTYISPKFTIMP